MGLWIWLEADITGCQKLYQSRFPPSEISEMTSCQDEHRNAESSPPTSCCTYIRIYSSINILLLTPMSYPSYPPEAYPAASHVVAGPPNPSTVYHQYGQISGYINAINARVENITMVKLADTLMQLMLEWRTLPWYLSSQ